MPDSDRETLRVFAGRYALLHELGHGAMGRVFRARDERLSRDVAVKVLLHGEHDETQVRRFEREARAAGSLNHPNILVVHDAGDQDGEPYLVTELLDGETVREALSAGPLEPARATDLALQTARGLAAAHEHGIVHRDLKPENLFITSEGVLKILDFGIAQLPRDPSVLDRLRTATGAPMGTVSYMSPEQVRGHQIDARSDLFAVGSVLYEMLSGTRPFDRATVLDTGHAILGESPPVLPAHVPRGLGHIVTRCLQKDPGNRFGSARELADALSGVPQRVSVARRRVAVIAVAMALSAGATAMFAHFVPHTTKTVPVAAGSDVRPLIAVADIANSTGDPELGALSDLLTVSLEQSRGVAVMTRSRLADLARQAGHSGSERIDEVVGRDVARRAGAKALLAATVHRLGSRYVVEMRAIDPEHDRYLFTIKEEAFGKEGLLPVIDRLSDRTRRELGDRPADIEASRIDVGTAITQNLEAYQHYIRGLELNTQYGELASAVKEWRRALELDPNLAIAHSMLVFAGYWYGRPQEVVEHGRAALASADRMPEKDRTIVLAADAALNNDRPKAMLLAEQLAARYPYDKTSQFYAARVIYRCGDLPRAEALYRRALQLDPGYFGPLWDLAWMLVNSRRDPEAVLLARRAVAARPIAANTAVLSWATATAGHPEEGVKWAREAIRLNRGASHYVTILTFQVLAFGGQVEEAERELRRFSAEGLNEDERDIGRFQLMGLQAYLGKRREALRSWDDLQARLAAYPVSRARILGVGRARLQASEALEFLRSAEQGAGVAPELAFHGDLAAAAKVAGRLSEGSPPHALYRAILLEQEKGRTESIEALRMLAANALWDDVPETQLLYLLAEMLLAASRPADAIEAMRPLRGTLTTGGNMLEMAENWPRAVFVRAEAYERLGEIGEAIRELDGLLATWRHADPDLPLLAEARAFRLRLATAIPEERAIVP